MPVYSGRWPDDRTELLRARGLRVTASRLAVLETLSSLPAHVTVEQVEAGARARLGALSTQAVYDTLTAFHREGHHPADPAGRVRRPATRPGSATTTTI